MKFQISDKNEGSKVTVTPRRISETLTLVDVDIRFEELQVPKTVTIIWQIPIIDMYSVWMPKCGQARGFLADWGKLCSESRLASGAPVQQYISHGGKNRYTVALSDADTPTTIASGVVEETATMEFELRIFTRLQNAIDSYHATLYLDSSDVPYEDALRAVDRWWRDECGYPNAHTPDTARRPMYSTWYSFHQDTDPEKIIAQCRMAKKLGMEAVIVDDGWQTADSNRGYAFCGDWEPSPVRIPDMKGFVDRVHAEGMKFILWFSMPFVGVHSKAYERFKDMSLESTRRGEGDEWYSLDPRYPEVRRYLVDIYVRAMKEWGLDGFKLDFIDSFRISAQTPPTDPRRDTESLDLAVDMLLCETTNALKAIDPDVLLEFRQGYIGPTIRKYGNMFRVGDCPDNNIRNRVAVVDLRFTTGTAAVHSDMLMWNADEPVEVVAKQMIATLFAVPQISVLLHQIPKEHYKMLEFYLNFWNKNRDILLDGTLYAEDPEMSYGCVRGSSERGEIAVVYVDKVVKVNSDNFVCINGKGGEGLVLDFGDGDAEAEYVIRDCMGNVTDSRSIRASGLCRFHVPVSGMVEIKY